MLNNICRQCADAPRFYMDPPCLACKWDYPIGEEDNYRHIIAQDDAYALLAALECEIRELVSLGVVPADSTIKAIADAKGTTDADANDSRTD